MVTYFYILTFQKAVSVTSDDQVSIIYTKMVEKLKLFANVTSVLYLLNHDVVSCMLALLDCKPHFTNIT